MSIDNSSKKRKAGYLEGWTSVILNTLLFALKYYAAMISNSIALVADAFHTLSDTMTSIVLLIGVRWGFKAPDREHPYGHQRLETISSIVIAAMLGVVGFEFFKQSLDKLLSRESLVYSDIAVAVMIFSVVAKEALARWALKLGKTYEMESVKADAWHHRSDAVASFLIVVGLLVGETYWWVDGVLGFLVSLLIVYTAWSLIKSASDKIIGRSPSPIEEEELKNIVFSTVPEAKDLHHIHIHEYGDHVEATLHIRFDHRISLEEAHKLATEIEEAVKKKKGWEVTIHVEPDKGVEYEHSTD